MGGNKPPKNNGEKLPQSKGGPVEFNQAEIAGIIELNRQKALREQQSYQQPRGQHGGGQAPRSAQPGYQPQPRGPQPGYPQAGAPQYGNSQPRGPQQVSEAEMLRRLLAAGATQQNPNYGRNPNQIDPRQAALIEQARRNSNPSSNVEAYTAPKAVSEKRKRRIGRKGIFAIGTAATVVIGGAIVGPNISNWINGNNDGASAAADTGVGVKGEEAQDSLSSGSLAEGQCELANAGFLVIRASGYLPLVPRLKETNAEGVVEDANVPKYLTEDKKEDLPKEDRDEFEEYITEDGYPRAYVEDLPMAVTICEPLGAEAFTEVDGVITDVKRPRLKVTVEGPDTLFDRNDLVTALYPVKDEDSGTFELDPDGGLHVAIMETTAFLGPKETDVAYNESLQGLIDNMGTDTQRAGILDLIKKSIALQLRNEVDISENITFENGGETFIDSIDIAFRDRFSDGQGISFDGGSYDISVNASSTPPIGLDATQEFVITSLTVKEEVLAAPAPKATPTPTPEPTEEPAVGP